LSPARADRRGNGASCQHEQVSETQGSRSRGSPSSELLGVTALVTGATSGLGLAMADALLAAGAQVLFAARPTERLARVVNQRAAQGAPAVAVPLDVRDPESVEAVAASLEGRFEVDLVVNNAGLGMRVANPRFLQEPQPFFSVDPGVFMDVVATNLTGYFLVGRAFGRRFAARRRGRIVNVTMNHETMVRRGFVPYGPSRAGAEALSRIMTEDLRPFGVAVNLLLPGGATATGMIPEDLPPEARARLLDPAVMGPPIVYLASPAAEGLTGARIIARDFSLDRAPRADVSPT
jgi:NAD(P)-dependent dehydrogenase (short-subunit alcohol dehydrogenase family)